MTILDFLLARTAEDEAAAKRRARDMSPRWSSHAPRMQAEYEAKRQIAAAHSPLYPPFDEDDHEMVCATCEDRLRHDAAAWPCTTLRLLTAVYADHPDYREEWRP